MPTKAIKTIEELLKNRKPIANANVTHQQSFTPVEKLAVKITDSVGSMGFFFIILLWTVLWLGWNILGPKNMLFDPYPAFVLWLFISNMIQIFLMPLIMIGQNLQGRHSEFRAEADFQVNIKAEQEIEIILRHLENQNELMIKILKNMEDNKQP
jgi:uncharacterized membrane protein